MSATLVRGDDLDCDPIFASFTAFHQRFAGIFSRPEPRSQAGKYLRALMGPVERRNGWQIAEAVGDTRPGPTQRLLHEAVWSADEAGNRLRDYVIEHFGNPEGIGVLDETGFLEKGTESVGVGRQYTGTAGKVENCQLGVFLSYACPTGHVLLEREIYLPKAWADDEERREKAKVPRQVRFQSKPSLARTMLARAWDAGVPMRWVTGDEVYGHDPTLRDFVATNDRLFVLAVRCNTRVWTARPALEPVPRKRKGRAGPGAMRVVGGTPPALSVDAVMTRGGSTAWHRLVTQFGEKGPIEHDWAAVRVVECRSRLPGPDRWLLVRRSVSNPLELAYYLSNAPLDTPLLQLARVASSRYTIEPCFGEAKGDVGMDHYEVRQWPSWYRHITLCMMALAWLTVVRGSVDQALLAAFRGVATPKPEPSLLPAPRVPATELEADGELAPHTPPPEAAPRVPGSPGTASATVRDDSEPAGSERGLPSVPAVEREKKRRIPARAPRA